MALQSSDLFIVQRNQQSYKMPASEILGIIPPAATVGDGTITIVQPGTTNQTFTVNQSGPTTITLKDTTYTLTTMPSGTGIRLQDSSGTPQDIALTAGSNVTISRDSAHVLTISAANTNTTYSAGNGISLTGTEFRVDAGSGLNQDAGGLSLSSIAGHRVLGNTGGSSAVPTAVQVDGDMIVSSVALAGNPTTTTQAAGTDNTTIATTEFVKAAVASEGIKILQVLVVAGGGGGGCQHGTGVGPAGGGAGGVISETEILVSGTTFNFSVGAGGEGLDSGNQWGLNGSDSTFGSYTAVGGGGGAHGGGQDNGRDGGSGGGGGGPSPGRGGSGVAGQGNNGGDGSGNNGGGGGGAGEAGGTADGNNAGKGGDGIVSSITGTATYYGGGGAGGRWQLDDAEAAAGLGGGGVSATNTVAAQNGVDGLGGGGGAGRGNWSGPGIKAGDGGNGVVIIRYPSSFTPTYTGGSPSRSTVGNDTVDVINFSGSVSF